MLARKARIAYINAMGSTNPPRLGDWGREIEMSAIYYTDAQGHAHTVDLSIEDQKSGVRCEADILGNMDMLGGGGVNLVPDCEDECESDVERAALEAGATYYADEDVAKWWIAYVVGFRATQTDVVEIAEQLGEMSDDELRAVAVELMGADWVAKTRNHDLAREIVDSLSEGANDYEDERGVFVANMAALREVLDAAEVGGE